MRNRKVKIETLQQYMKILKKERYIFAKYKTNLKKLNGGHVG